MDMQDKMMGEIKRIVESMGFDFVQQQNWSNTGNVLIQKKGTFTSKFSFHYDFQSSYATLQFYPAGKKPIGTCGFTHEDCIGHFYFDYVDSTAIAQVFGRVTDWCRDKQLLPPILNPRRKAT